jgi:hypothetical protein
MPVNAIRLIRKMRGGAQAHMLEASDGKYYVVKFRNNPQHRRILINEWVSSVFLEYLEISQPRTAVVELSREFVEANPDVHIQLGSRRVPVEPGWHFGSCYPGNPDTQAVYDFIPDTLMEKVSNFRHFLGVLAFDKWAGNADARQSIFFRARIREWVPGEADERQRVGFIVQMLDHGYVFDGPHWGFQDSPLGGLYYRPQVYRSVTSYGDFHPWLDRIENFPEDVFDRAYRQIPESWMNGDRDTLEQLLEKLLLRRKRVADLLLECRRGRFDPFPNWGSMARQ